MTKAPDHPVLNYHMGKLIATDRSRARKASPYLEKARVGRNRLSPPMATDLASKMQNLGMRGN